jgi:hypothetical protein
MDAAHSFPAIPVASLPIPKPTAARLPALLLPGGVVGDTALSHEGSI